MHKNQFIFASHKYGLLPGFPTPAGHPKLEATRWIKYPQDSRRLTAEDSSSYPAGTRPDPKPCAGEVYRMNRAVCFWNEPFCST